MSEILKGVEQSVAVYNAELAEIAQCRIKAENALTRLNGLKSALKALGLSVTLTVAESGEISYTVA